MSRATPRLVGARDAASVLVISAGAAGLGAMFALGAWLVDPLAPLGALALAGLVVATLREPAVGIAAGFLLVPLSNLGLTGRPPWLLTTAWGAFLAGVAVWRFTAPTQTAAERRIPPLALAVGVNLLVGFTSFALSGLDPEGYPELRSMTTGILYFTAIALLVRTPRQFEWCLGGIAACLTLVGGLATWERLRGATSGEAFFTPGGELIGRVAAGFGHPNELGGFLVILLPFAVGGLVLSRRLRPFFAVAIVLAAFGIYGSFSRGALVAMITIPFVFLRGRKLLVIAPLLALLLTLATPQLVKERFATLTESGSEVATRVEFWHTGLTIWSEHPIQGVGLGGFPTAYAEARVPGRGFLPGTVSKPPPHAHNLFVQELATEGLIGLLALLSVLGTATVMAVRLRRRGGPVAVAIGSAALASLVAFLVHNQFDVTLLEGTGIYFWAVLGLLAAGSLSVRDGEGTP